MHAEPTLQPSLPLGASTRAPCMSDKQRCVLSGLCRAAAGVWQQRGAAGHGAAAVGDAAAAPDLHCAACPGAEVPWN